MSPFDGENIVVVDLEVARSPEDCMCGKSKDEHYGGARYCSNPPQSQLYHPIGWGGKAALGLSIGGFYDYHHNRIYWFNEYNLETWIGALVNKAPMIVSFNGLSFGFPLIEEILRLKANSALDPDEKLHLLCDRFSDMTQGSYDIFAEICASGQNKPGQTTLGALCEANGLGRRLRNKAQTPRDWAAGKHADVNNFLSDDIYKTKALFELICHNGGWLRRGDGVSIGIPWINEDGERQPPQAIAWGG